MKNKLTHFAVYTDDLDRAKGFYSKLFGWKFNSYGAASFAQIKTGDSEEGELIGALQSREYSPTKEKVIGLECSIEVDNVDDTIQLVTENGGQILMPKTAIPHVGWITKFLDTEGNLLCAMEYNNNAK